ncbi:MAG: beta-galactosidase [Tannerellaceae bacterium]|nr:beta-galactosidase [Tannerellaceae bacterium]
MKGLIYIAMMLAALYSCRGAREMDLSGPWAFALDTADVGLLEHWYDKPLADMIMLPGSLQERGYGYRPGIDTRWTGQIVDSSWFKASLYEPYRREDNIKIPFWLQPERTYVGVAWYQREVYLPPQWKGKYIELELERTHWQTTLFVNGSEAGSNDALLTPHRYAVDGSGRIVLTLRVDNRVHIPVGINAHSVSDHTQTNWNGIIGRIRLRAKPALHIAQLTVYPDIAARKATVELLLSHKAPQDAGLRLYVEAFNCGEHLASKVRPVNITIAAGSSRALAEIDMGDDVLLWSEHEPNLYRLRAELSCRGESERSSTVFGMREFRAEGTRFRVNGRPVFLRGTLECCIFPLTGYPPTTEDYWEKIFSRCKEYGLNHVRFHSWCPPEAAFSVADRKGLYLQVECGAWATVGSGGYIDRWFYAESERIVREYGNHPSFCIMLYGNEPNGRNQVAWLSDFVSWWKAQDARRVYSGGAGWPDIDAADFRSTPDPRIQAWGAELNSIINAHEPHTSYDWRAIIAKEPLMPVVSHEIGQWCVYPNFDEMPKYSGILKPKNFEIFSESLSRNHIGDMARPFLMASGALQMLCYKADIEAALRTPGFAGFQLLDLHDFPGQGTALVGVLDAFWDEKPYASGEAYRSFCNTVVPLARMEKMIYTDVDTFRADVEVSQFSMHAMENAAVEWKLYGDDAAMTVVASGSRSVDLPVDNCIPIASLEVPLSAVKTPAKLTLEVSIAGTPYANRWNIWVYSSTDNQPLSQSAVYVTDDINRAIPALEAGSDVLYCLPRPALKPDRGGDISVGFSTIFWNTAWTRNQAPHTLGLLCEPSHPALAGFPNDGHSDYQWWEITTGCAPVLLDSFPATLRPIVWIIDDWFTNRRLGMLVEGKFGKGRMIISGADLLHDLHKRHAARQLRHSLESYMASDSFNPSEELSMELVKDLLK